MKHSAQDIQQMARVALSAKQAQDPRWDTLLEALHVRLGVPKDQIEQNIILLVMGMNV